MTQATFVAAVHCLTLLCVPVTGVLGTFFAFYRLFCVHLFCSLYFLFVAQWSSVNAAIGNKKKKISDFFYKLFLHFMVNFDRMIQFLYFLCEKSPFLLGISVNFVFMWQYKVCLSFCLNICLNYKLHKILSILTNLVMF